MTLTKDGFMLRKLALAVAFTAAVVAPVRAQNTVAVKDSSAFVGNWEGAFTSDHAPAGEMRIAISHDAGWKAKMEVSLHADTQLDLTNFQVSGTKATWSGEMMGAQCTGSATVSDSALTGSIDCAGHGTVDFTLRKK
jgi:hypothetical protein